MDRVINFFYEDSEGFELDSPEVIRNWILEVIDKEGAQVVEINYIFCGDEYLRQINVGYLNHDTFTDIITFDNSEQSGQIEADIYISVDRVQDNANTHDNSFNDELHRVMIHGVLHLLGQGDKTDKESAQMRKREEACLSLRNI